MHALSTSFKTFMYRLNRMANCWTDNVAIVSASNK